MKKLIIMSLMLISMMAVQAHTLTKQCWNSGTYDIAAAYGDGNGKIEVTVYSNSNMNTVVQAKRTFNLSSSGTVNFTVNQSSRTSPVFVYVRWFQKNSNGTYSAVSWNSGQGYPNSYSSVSTGTNQCSVVPVGRFTNIYAQRLSGNTFKVFFDVNEDLDTDRFIIRISTDAKKFKDRAIIFPDNSKAGKYEVIIKL